MPKTLRSTEFDVLLLTTNSSWDWCPAFENVNICSYYGDHKTTNPSWKVQVPNCPSQQHLPDEICGKESRQMVPSQVTRTRFTCFTKSSWQLTQMERNRERHNKPFWVPRRTQTIHRTPMKAKGRSTRIGNSRKNNVNKKQENCPVRS